MKKKMNKKQIKKIASISVYVLLALSHNICYICIHISNTKCSNYYGIEAVDKISIEVNSCLQSFSSC